VCQIVVDRIEGAQFEPSLNVFTAVNVIGTVQGCPATLSSVNGDYAEVAVTLFPESGPPRTETAQVLTNNNLIDTFSWSAFFKDVPCGGKARVVAVCVGAPECIAEVELTMSCEPSSCPAVTFSEPEDAGCDDQERRLVTLTATVQGPPLNQFVQWRFGDNRQAQSAFENSNQTTVTLAYEEGDLAHPQVVFGLNPDCEYTLEIPGLLLQPCAAACPEVSFGTPRDGGCDEEGNRILSVTAQISGEPLTGYYPWHYGNGRTINDYLNEENESSVDLLYATGDLEHPEITLELSPECLYQLRVPERLLQPCSAVCPEVRFGSPRDGGCDGEGNRIVEISAQFSGDPVSGYIPWRYGDGRTVTDYLEAENESSVELVFAPADLEHPEVELELTTDCRYGHTLDAALLQPCPPAEEEPPREGNGETPPPPADGNVVFNPCLLWLIANLVLLIGTGILIVVAACAPNPYTIAAAIALAVVTAISWILFFILCVAATSNCTLGRWASFLLDLLVSVMAVIAIVWGIVTAIFEVTVGCLIGALITFAYYALMALWFKIAITILGCYRNASYFPWED